jgi:hypothetical protein
VEAIVAVDLVSADEFETVLLAVEVLLLVLLSAVGELVIEL